MEVCSAMNVRLPARAVSRSLVCGAAAIALCVMNATSVNAAEAIKIGAVLPFSGGVELYGAQAKLGLDLAAADIAGPGARPRQHRSGIRVPAGSVRPVSAPIFRRFSPR
jgi:hypothetical protein